jgi:hypothetical protein
VCENTIGSHLCGPFSIRNTLVALNGYPNKTGPGTNVTVNSLLGGTWVEWTINHGNMTITDITYHQVVSPFLTRSCLEFEVMDVSPPSDIYSRIRCRMAAGHGQSFQFTIHFCSDTRCNSTRGTDLVSYPPPEPIAGTLRLVDDGIIDGQGAPNVVAPDLNQHLIAFDGRNILNDSNLLSIWFGPFYRLHLFECDLIDELSTDYRVVCRTEPGAYGSGMRFTLIQDGYRVIASDTFSFPTSTPVIISVSGCDPDPDSVNATINCPTLGGNMITIHGHNFLEPVSAFVNGQSCIIDTHPVASTMVRCTMPVGAGFEQSVVYALLAIRIACFFIRFP